MIIKYKVPKEDVRITTVPYAMGLAYVVAFDYKGTEHYQQFNSKDEADQYVFIITAVGAAIAVPDVDNPVYV